MLYTLRHTLRSPDLTAAWDGCIAQWQTGTAEQRQSVLDWVHELRDEFLTLADDVQDEKEIEMSVAVRTIELKSHWMMLNTRIQYELLRHGGTSEELVYRASVCSMLIGALEELLTEEDRLRIVTFLARPLARAA